MPPKLKAAASAAPPSALRTLSAEQPPTPPHSEALLIVRAPGGFSLFDGYGVSPSPEQAAALASTPLALLDQVRAWALATPAPEYPA